MKYNKTEEWDRDDPSDYSACEYLREQGYIESPNGYWIKPYPDYRVSAEELAAIWFLIDEYDFGGIID